MAAVLRRAGALPALLSVCRSALVRHWGPPEVDRALQWARYFRHLHGRCRARLQLRQALARRLRRAEPRAALGFGALGRGPQLVALALLQNRALPPVACRRLLLRLLRPHGPAAPALPLLARRKAAARLLLLLPLPLPRRNGPEPPLRAEALLLLARLREDRRDGAAPAEWLGSVLGQLPQPRALALVAAALALLGQGNGDAGHGDGDWDGSGAWGDGDWDWDRDRDMDRDGSGDERDRERDGDHDRDRYWDGSDGERDRDGSSLEGSQGSAAGDGCIAGLLLSWLLGSLERFSAFCLSLPGALLASLAGHYPQLSGAYLELLSGWGSHLHYDPLQGRWVKSVDKAELSWEELRERFGWLCQGPAPLREHTHAALKLQKTRDGDFEVRGLSVWTDLLMEVGEYLRDEAGADA